MRFNLAITFVFSLLIAACGPSGGGGGDTPDSGSADGCPAEGQTRCDGNTFQTCTGGSWTVSEQCTAICDSTRGCVDCVAGVDYCIGNDVHGCDAEGNATGLVESCGSLQCSAGTCRDLCQDAADSRSYLGCEYWAVDLDNGLEVHGLVDPLFECLLFGESDKVINNVQVCVNASNATGGVCHGDGSCPANFTCQTESVCGLDAQHSPFAIVVSNPQALPVDVTISNRGGVTQTVAVNAGEVRALFPQQMGFPDQSINNSTITAGAYRVSSTAPIVAYQFNPLDNVDVFSNDGSLLIPRTTFDTKYIALSWPTTSIRATEDFNDLHGYVSVVAWEDATVIAVTPTANVKASTTQAAITAGVRTEFTLQAHEVLNLEAVGDGDLTGTVIESTNGTTTFGAFGGHEAVLIQDPSSSCCADHMEEMLFPTSTWGMTYAIARSQPRRNEADILRILAQTDGTAVTFNPAGGLSCPTLNAGQFCDVDVMGDIEVTATQPILVGHYLKSVIYQPTPFSPFEGNGDPSMAISVPTEQFRSSYAFLIPAEYDEQYISVVTTTGATVGLDGTDVTAQFTGFGSGAYAAARIQVTPGQHTLSCSSGCGLEVYGYSDAVSYLFAGGLDLRQIVVD